MKTMRSSAQRCVSNTYLRLILLCVVGQGGAEGLVGQPLGVGTGDLSLCSFSGNCFSGLGQGVPFPEKNQCLPPLISFSTISLFDPYSLPGPRERVSQGWEKRKPWGQVASGQRVTYDLKERMCIGSMTTLESAAYQRVPTDEAEAQMLASADLDGMKSEVLPHYSMFVLCISLLCSHS